MIIVSKNMNPVTVVSKNLNPLRVVSKNMNPLRVVSIPMRVVYDPNANQYVFVGESGNPFISEDNQNKFKTE
jgi:hypothetical protein